MTHHPYSVCDQSTFESLSETADGLRDLFTAMCQEMNGRESRPGEDQLIASVEVALEETLKARGLTQTYAVEKLVLPAKHRRSPEQTAQEIRELAKRMKASCKGTVSDCCFRLAELAFEYIEGEDVLVPNETA